MNQQAVSNEALMFGHLALSGVPEEAIKVLFQYGVAELDQLPLLNKEILEKMDMYDEAL